MVQAADFGKLHDLSCRGELDRPEVGCILVECEVNADPPASHGRPRLKTALVQAAWCTTRAKPNYLRSQFLRLKGRRGPKKAIIAVAASILTAAYFIIRDGVEYRELGADHLDRLDKHSKLRRLLRQLSNLGYDVTINRAA
jgi:transposase